MVTSSSRYQRKGPYLPVVAELYTNTIGCLERNKVMETTLFGERVTQQRPRCTNVKRFIILI